MTALALGFSLGAQEPAFRPQDDLGGTHAETWLATFGPRIHRVLQGLDASPKQSSARMLRAF